MSTQKPLLTAAEHINEAKGYLAEGASASAQQAIGHALVAIAELMATNMATNMTNVIIDSVGRGAMATAEAIGTISSVFGPLPHTTEHICATCHAHHDKHSSDDLSCPAWVKPDGEIVFSTTHRYVEKTGQ